MLPGNTVAAAVHRTADFRAAENKKGTRSENICYQLKVPCKISYGQVHKKRGKKQAAENTHTADVILKSRKRHYEILKLSHKKGGKKAEEQSKKYKYFKGLRRKLPFSA